MDDDIFQGSKTIHRAPRGSEHPYFMVSRDTARDSHIAYDSLGLLTYLLSMVDHWEVRVETLYREKGGEYGKASKREAVTRMLKELREHGYMALQQIRNADQTFAGTRWLVSEEPVFKDFDPPDLILGVTEPESAFPTAVLPTAGNQQQRSTKERSRSTELSAALTPTFVEAKNAIAALFGYSWDTMTQNEIGRVETTASQWIKAGGTLEELTHTYNYCKKRFRDEFGPVALTTNRGLALAGRIQTTEQPPPWAVDDKPVPPSPVRARFNADGTPITEQAS